MEYKLKYRYKGDIFIIEGIPNYYAAHEQKEDIEKEKKVFVEIIKIP